MTAATICLRTSPRFRGADSKRSRKDRKSSSKSRKARRASRLRTSKPQASGSRGRRSRPRSKVTLGFRPREFLGSAAFVFCEREKSLGVEAFFRRSRALPSVHAPPEFCFHRAHEFVGGKEGVVRTYQDCQILGHLARFHDVDADLFQGLSESGDFGRAVHAAAKYQAARPSENRGDGVG